MTHLPRDYYTSSWEEYPSLDDITYQGDGASWLLDQLDFIKRVEPPDALTESKSPAGSKLIEASRLTEDDIQRFEQDIRYAPYLSLDVEMWDPYRFRKRRSDKLDKQDRPPQELAFLLLCSARMRTYIIDLRKMKNDIPERLLRLLCRRDVYWLGAQDMALDFQRLGVTVPPPSTRLEPAKLMTVLGLIGYKNFLSRSGSERLSLGHFAFWLWGCDHKCHWDTLDDYLRDYPFREKCPWTPGPWPWYKRKGQIYDWGEFPKSINAHQISYMMKNALVPMLFFLWASLATAAKDIMDFPTNRARLFRNFQQTLDGIIGEGPIPSQDTIMENFRLFMEIRNEQIFQRESAKIQAAAGEPSRLAPESPASESSEPDTTQAEREAAEQASIIASSIRTPKTIAVPDLYDLTPEQEEKVRRNVTALKAAEEYQERAKQMTGTGAKPKRPSSSSTRSRSPIEATSSTEQLSESEPIASGSGLQTSGESQQTALDELYARQLQLEEERHREHQLHYKQKCYSFEQQQQALEEQKQLIEQEDREQQQAFQQ